MTRRFIGLLFCIGYGLLPAQDLHFSQFYNSPLNIDPGKTGVFDGDQRFHAGYRTQWRNIVPWNTFSAAYDKKFISKCCDRHSSYFSGGILFNYDKSSEFSDLTLTNFNLTGSYTLALDTSNFLTFGGLAGMATRAFDENTLIWDKQWDGRVFDRNAPTGEAFSSDKVTYVETALGINYRWRKSHRTRVDLGIGLFHLIQPSVGFYDADDIQLFKRVSYTGIGHFQLVDNFDIQLNIMFQDQGPYEELVYSGLAKFHLNEERGKNLEVHLGLGHRTTGSLFPILAVQYKNMYGSISYDIDMTSIDEIKGVRPNALELHFIYIITNPVWKTKVCPIY